MRMGADKNQHWQLVGGMDSCCLHQCQTRRSGAVSCLSPKAALSHHVWFLYQMKLSTLLSCQPPAKQMSCKSLALLPPWATPPAYLPWLFFPFPCYFPLAGAPIYLLLPGKGCCWVPIPGTAIPNTERLPAPAQLHVPTQNSLASFPLLIKMLFLCFECYNLFTLCLSSVLSSKELQTLLN